MHNQNKSLLFPLPPSVSVLLQEHKYLIYIVYYKHISWKNNKDKAKLHILQVEINKQAATRMSRIYTAL